jgi:hypothetical protein
METIRSRRLVERFYHEVWNKGDETVAHEILGLTFASDAHWDRGAGRTRRVHRLHAPDPHDVGPR